jgi:glycosyltransferase involved in cell wall biosynthesis
VVQRGKNGKPRFAVLCDNVHLEAVPFVREPLVHLAAEGFGIDLVAPSASYGYPEWTPVEGVRQLVVSGYRDRPTAQDVRTLGWIALRGLVRRDYAAVLATPIVSVVLGAVLSGLWHVPLVVLSDELYTEGDANSPHPRWHRVMHRAHARAALTIIPDLRRAELLRSEAALLKNQAFVELPNTPSGVAATGDRDGVRKRLRVAPDDVLVLSSGGIYPWTRAPELLSALPSLAANTVLVFQMNTRADPSTRELYDLLERAYPVRFLPDPVPYEQVDEIVTACDIGVALYRDENPNLAMTGKSSGKLGRYLRAGKPVIVDRTGGLDWVADYGAGEILTDTTELPTVIEKIMADYARYAERARECYAEHLAFESYWPGVRAALADVMNHAGSAPV